jgi:CTP synthase
MEEGMTKNIFVTGGVVSSLGKGLTCASIGFLLERMGLRIAMQKFDPYINVDPGTMNPYQHGEVYVTQDGVETDLDLGHYERFTHAIVNAHSNHTTGKIYSTVIARERRGEYLGQTVQVVPHITNEIKDCIRLIEGPDVDVAITEIGGTVGDIESLPFLEAVRQYRLEKGPGATAAVHLTLIPYLRASQEMKSKPTQQSVGRLREIGILPDLLICRTEKPLTEDLRAKISLFCNVPRDHVVEERDVEFSIYQIPVMLYEQGVHRILARILGLPEREPAMEEWIAMLEGMRHPERTVEIAIVGKYLDVHDAYKSIYEALTHGAIANRVALSLRKVPADDLTPQNAERLLGGVHAILVPGGFGQRGIEGKILAARYARERRIPYYGLCLGMQVAAIEFARNVLGLTRANSVEFDPHTPDPVIDLMESQRSVRQMGGTMRLGSYPCRLLPGSRAAEAYGTHETHERHRHRYEFSNRYRARFEEAGMRFSGIWPEGDLVEIMELTNHPWYIGVQFHPEFQSKPDRPHPLFRGFVRAAKEFAERSG